MPGKNENVYVKVSGQVKKEATKVFKQLGLSMSDGIGLYLKQIVIKKGIPFTLNLQSDYHTYDFEVGKDEIDRVVVRINENTKAAAEEVLKTIQLSMTDAVTIYLIEVIRSRGIPFSIKAD